MGASSSVQVQFKELGKVFQTELPSVNPGLLQANEDEQKSSLLGPMWYFRPCWPQHGCFDSIDPSYHGSKFLSLVLGSLSIPVDLRVQLCCGSEMLQVSCVIASFSCPKQQPLSPPVQQSCRNPRATAAPTAFQKTVTNASHGSASFRINGTMA